MNTIQYTELFSGWSPHQPPFFTRETGFLRHREILLHQYLGLGGYTLRISERCDWVGLGWVPGLLYRSVGLGIGMKGGGERGEGGEWERGKGEGGEVYVKQTVERGR